MKRPRLLVADARCFDRRKFRPLFDLAAKGSFRLWVERSRAQWWGREGDYRALADKLASHRRTLEGLEPAHLEAHRYRDIGVLACARSELLRLLLPRWAATPAATCAAEVIDRACASVPDREDMLLCMAAAQDWIDFWHEALAREGPFSHAVAYRGSSICSRTLLETGRRQGLRMFVADRFPTGRDFYFEERATPISNRSLLADADWYGRLALPPDASRRERMRAEAQSRLAPILPAVTARPAAEDMVATPFEGPTKGIALVLGQAINDLSLIETPLPELSAPVIYRRLIGGILERTDFHVVFKADPDERRQPNIAGPLTLKLLAEWRDTLPAAPRARFSIMETEPMGVLFSHADLVVSLSSPLIIDACQAGFKPVQLGRAFCGGKGFTHDFADADAFLDALAAHGLDGALSLDEYRMFEDFLARALLLHLVPEGREGVGKIAARLAESNHVPALRECDFSPTPRLLRLQTMANAIANPAAALRLATTWPLRDST
jgi:hypothetical protein